MVCVEDWSLFRLILNYYCSVSVVFICVFGGCGQREIVFLFMILYSLHLPLKQS